MGGHASQPHAPAVRKSIVVPAVLAVTLLASGVALILWSMAGAGLGDLEHEETSAFSRIRIRRDGDVRLMTFVRDNGQEAVQTRVNISAPQTLLSPYAHGMFTSYLYQPNPRRVLIVGLGGGAMVRFLAHHEPQVQVDAVEIDPVVVKLADQYFGTRTGGNVRIHTADAVKFIASTTDRYDVILMDAFLRPSDDTDSTGVPKGFKTIEFLKRLKQSLAPGGVVAFNVNEHDTIAEDIAAVRTAFGNATVYRCPPAENRVVVATESAVASEDELAGRVDALTARFKNTLAFADLLKNRE